MRKEEEIKEKLEELEKHKIAATTPEYYELCAEIEILKWVLGETT